MHWGVENVWKGLIKIIMSKEGNKDTGWRAVNKRWRMAEVKELMPQMVAMRFEVNICKVFKVLITLPSTH